MTYVTEGRDALRKVGYDHAFVVDDDAYGMEGCNCGWRRGGFDDATHEDHLMSALIASGAVVAADTLADDAFGDELLAVARGVEGEVASAVNGWGASLVRVERCYSHGIARAALRALAAALSERGQ